MNPPVARGSRWGVRSPVRYGRDTRPSLPGRTAAAPPPPPRRGAAPPPPPRAGGPGGRAELGRHVLGDGPRRLWALEHRGEPGGGYVEGVEHLGRPRACPQGEET